MNLYILRPIKDWEPWYDRAFGFVVRAASARNAREAAAAQWQHGDEGAEVWRDPKLTSCQILRSEGEEGVVLRDFRSA